MSGWFIVSHSVLTGFNSCDMGKVYTDNKTKILDFGMETEWESSFSAPADIKTMQTEGALERCLLRFDWNKLRVHTRRYFLAGTICNYTIITEKNGQQ